ncbi:hypothetical protein [Streptomyces sp. RFCAC02]|uniref:hypothetical protein n=1 Tax=Streptomyces sp. RFCAC02 TaxID=2499143 RepID=UPI001F10BB0A|nr:hypothetical protein [Streptomyces sp. RFCAC02]
MRIPRRSAVASAGTFPSSSSMAGSPAPAARPAVPAFPPVRPRGGGWRPWRALRGRRRAVALSLTAAGAVLAVALPGGVLLPGTDVRSEPAAARPAVAPAPVAAESAGSADAVVRAPVRIADAAAAALIEPGDRVDVLAAFPATAGQEVRAAEVVARRATVAEVPRADGAGPVDGAGGALLVLNVPRRTAAELAGAAAVAELAVTRW